MTSQTLSPAIGPMDRAVIAVVALVLTATAALAAIVYSAQPADAHPRCGVGNGHIDYNWNNSGWDYKGSPGNPYWEGDRYICKINEWKRKTRSGDHWHWNGTHTHVVTRRI